MDLSIVVDSYSKTAPEKLFEMEWSRQLGHLGGPHRDAWIHFWLAKHTLMKDRFLQARPEGVVDAAPLCRSEFERASLEEIVQQPASKVSVYLIGETIFTSTYKTREDFRFRVHTRPDVSVVQPYLFRDWRVPVKLHDVDILPWFRAMLLRLPKRKQPRDTAEWLARLRESHPTLAELKPSSLGVPWELRWKITLILGDERHVGCAPIFHLERSGIRHFVRQESLVSLVGAEKCGDLPIVARKFHLFTISDAAAESLEREMINGSRAYFGIGPTITGLIAICDTFVHAIGLSDETIRRYCERPEWELVLESRPRERLRFYSYRRRS